MSQLPADDWDTTHADPRPAGSSTGAASADPTPTTYYSSLIEWYEDFFKHVYRRNFSASHLTWCDQWWRHPEAVSRLDALWRAWEHLRLEPGLGMSVWWRDHVDPHMAALTSPDGCLKGCQPTAEPEPGVHNPRVTLLPSAPPPFDIG